MTSTTTETPIAEPPAPTAEVELLIGGMTCASCAARVEKKLNRMDGVVATVNYATEKARVSYPAGTEVADLIATVVKTGYTAEEPVPAPEPVSRRTPPRTPSSRTCGTGSSSPCCSPRPSSCSRWSRRSSSTTGSGSH